MEKICWSIFLYIYDSNHCCTAEINILNQLYLNKMRKKKCPWSLLLRVTQETAPSSRMKGPSPHPWSMGWPCDLIWPTSCGWSVGVPVLRQGLKGLAGVTSSWLTGRNLGQPVGGEIPSGGEASCTWKGQPRPAYSQLTLNSCPAGLWAVVDACDFKPQHLEWFAKHKAARKTQNT